jgi:glutathione S-transferase
VVYGKIPVLLLPDGRAICQSAVIVDEACGSSSRLMPEDPYQRAMHRFWTAFVDDRFWPALDAVSLGPTREARAQAVADARAALQLLEEAFRSSRSGDDKQSFFSTAPGLLDVALGCFLPAIRACERLHGLTLIDASATPVLHSWSQRFAALPAARTVLPDTDKVVNFTKFLQATFGVDLSK